MGLFAKVRKGAKSAKYTASNLAKLAFRRNIGLFEMPKRDLRQLGRRIRTAGGKVIILMHPHYANAPQRYEAAIRKIMAQEKTPVIILEEDQSVQRTRGKLAKAGSPDHLIVPTIYSSTILKWHGLRYFEVDENHSVLSEILKQAGAKTVYVGGMYTRRAQDAVVLGYERNWLKGRLPETDYSIVTGCAGRLYKELIHGGQFEKVRWLTAAMHDEKPKWSAGKKA